MAAETVGTQTVVVRLFLDGWSTQAISDAVGLDPSTVRRSLRRQGYEMGPCGPRASVPDQTISAMLDRGLSIAQVAVETGLSKGGAETRIVDVLARRNAQNGAWLSDQQLLLERAKGASWRGLAFSSGQPRSTVRARWLRLVQPTGSHHDTTLKVEVSSVHDDQT